jgi:hypothetical protein
MAPLKRVLKEQQEKIAHLEKRHVKVREALIYVKAPFSLMPSCLCTQTLKAEKRIAARLAKNLKAGWFSSRHNHYCVDYFWSSSFASGLIVNFRSVKVHLVCM